MDFLELSKAKSSERNFDSTRPVEEEKPSKILEAGKSAPTAGNHRPRHVYVPKGEIR